MSKKKRRRKSRIAKIKSAPIETPLEQRKKFPKKLIEAFVNLNKTSVLGTDFDFEYYEWTTEAYQLYWVEAKKYLGSKAKDRIESGMLITLLSKATRDLQDGKKEKAKKAEEN